MASNIYTFFRESISKYFKEYDDKFIKSEIPIGLINGVNNTFFALHSFYPETLEVFINGVRQEIINDYNFTNTQIILNFVLNLGETITINYKKI